MEIITQHLCKSTDLGLRGNVFGGTLLSWLDDAGFIFAAKVCHTPYLVTACLKEVNFKQPIGQGDLVTIFGEVVKMGRTSVTIYLEARKWIFERDTDKQTITSTSIVFVKIDPETGLPSPIEYGKNL